MHCYSNYRISLTSWNYYSNINDGYHVYPKKSTVTFSHFVRNGGHVSCFYAIWWMVPYSILTSATIIIQNFCLFGYYIEKLVKCFQAAHMHEKYCVYCLHKCIFTECNMMIFKEFHLSNMLQVWPKDLTHNFLLIKMLVKISILVLTRNHSGSPWCLFNKLDSLIEINIPSN